MTGRVLVTGGTGTTGRRVAELLRSRGVPTRTASRHPAGGDHVVFDWTDPATHAAALAGVERVYLVPPPAMSPEFAGILDGFLATARTEGVRRSVLLSSSLSSLRSGQRRGTDAQGSMARSLRSLAGLRGLSDFDGIADAVSRGFPEWAVLRASWFMQNVIGAHPTAVDIRERGEIATATGESRIAFVDAEDIAASAVAALLADEPPNTDYVLTGPEALSYRQVAATITEVTGFPVRYVDLTAEQRAAHWVEAGLPPAVADRAAKVDLMLRDGVEDRTTTAVAELTGSEPRSFRAFVAANRNAWHESRRNAS